MSIIKITEQGSLYENLEQQQISTLLFQINQEDQKVAIAISKSLEQIENLLIQLVPKIEQRGRLFYIGAGTSGRLGVLDASECPPTYGVSDDVVIGIIAGGENALRNAVENAEDDENQAIIDLSEFSINSNDVLIGIAASGTTPYVIGGIKAAKRMGILTGCITCNKDSPLAQIVDFPIEVIVGPEFVTGSTRMKAGTAQKMVLNMISTTLMIKLGRVKGNKMVDMKLNNDKLVNRAIKMLMLEAKISENEAKDLLLKHGSVRKALEFV